MKQLSSLFNAPGRIIKDHPNKSTQFKYPLFKICCFLMVLLFLCESTKAQSYRLIEHRIDSLMNIGLPKSALTEVDKLEQLARRNKNAPQQIKAVIYRMKLLSYVEENAFVAIINQLKYDSEQAKYPVKPVLQSMLAEMYWKYYQQNRWSFATRSHVEIPDSVDITRWDLQTIINQTSGLYRLSLHDEKQEQLTPIEVLDSVLIGDKKTRMLRPTLYDLLVNRAFDFFLADEPAVTKPRMPFTLSKPELLGNAADFAKLSIKTTDTASTYYWAMRYLQQATRFHLQQSHEDAAIDLDLKRLGFLYNKAAFEDKDSLYLKALHEIVINFPRNELSAQALVMMGQYEQGRGDLVAALQYFNKANDTFRESVGGKNAGMLAAQITAGSLSAQVENTNIPGRPILGLITYKNIKAARVLIYKLSRKQWDDYYYLKSDGKQQGTIGSGYKSKFPKDSLITYLKKIPPVREQTVSLPDPADYQEHSAEFKIDALQAGEYLMWLKDDRHDELMFNCFTEFTLSNLAYNSRKRFKDSVDVVVTDRTTGRPLKGVYVVVSDANFTYNTTKAEVLKTGMTDGNGTFKTTALYEQQQVKQLIFKGDTLSVDNTIYSQSSDESTRVIFRTILFSDRQIYRPGQTVYFKALNIRIQNKQSTIVANTPLTIFFKDANNKTIDTLKLQTNNFGSAAGSFIIPSTTLNGRFAIETVQGYLAVRVEEYKRPTFQLKFDPVTKAYKLNDTVTVSGSVNAFSGYGLSQAKIVYHVTRSIETDDYYAYRATYGQLQSRDNNLEILTDTIKTSSQGTFSIKFKAVPTAINRFVSYNYKITADVTDQSGETRSADTRVKVSDHPLYIFTDNMPYRINKGDSLPVTVTLTNFRQHVQTGTIVVMAYSLKQPGQYFKLRYWDDPDQHILTKNEYQRIFPDYMYNNEGRAAYWPILNKVASEQITINDSAQVYTKMNMLKNLDEGFYRIKMEGRTPNGDTASLTRYLTVVGSAYKPIVLQSFSIPVNIKVEPGGKAEFLVGIGKPIYVLMEKFEGNKLASSEWLHIGNEVRKISRPVTNIDTRFEFSMYYQSRYYYTGYKTEPAKPDSKLDIRFISYHNLLLPGQKEQWRLQVKAKDEKTVAEMVATLYDASLDDIDKPVKWPELINKYNGFYPRPNSSWGNYSYQNVASTDAIYSRYVNHPFLFRSYEKLDLLGYNYYGGYNVGYHNYRAMLAHGVGSLSINARDMTTASATINSKDMEELQATSIDQALQGRLPGVDIVAASGDPSAGTDVEKDKVYAINTRKNFNETAFFYPQLHTDKKGEITIDFTMPETLTKWHFKAFAHTEDFKTASLESEIVTQKKLSISANMPRFLREGDTLTVSARLANLTASTLKGKVNLQLFNAINMQPLLLLAGAADAQQSFALGAVTNKAVSFKLIVPAGLDALTYRLTAEAGQFTDGEENTIPVLPNRTLVTESMPMMVRAGQSRMFRFDKLMAQHSATLKNKTLTLEYTQNPAWYAVQTLPYMMEFPYECSEQVFSRYYANSLATNLVNKMPLIKQVFDQWKAGNSAGLLSNLEKNQELKATLIEETPWLRDAENEAAQKKRLSLLFDLNKMSYELQLNINKLQKMQLPDGGFAWFGGDRADLYITRHILAGMGQLYHLAIVDTKNETLKSVADKAMSYLNTTLIDDANGAKKRGTYEGRILSTAEIHAYYAQSYYPGRIMTAETQALLVDYLALAEKQWKYKTVYDQGMMALTMLRNKKPEVARMIIRSLTETAQHADDLGMYWGKNVSGYRWYQSPVETQSLMIELFTEAGNYDKAVDEMKLWLLRNKQTNNWNTTKATAAACYALLLNGDSLLAADRPDEITLGGKVLTDLKPDLKAEAGTGYIKTTWTDDQIKPALGVVNIKNSSKTASWGAVYWQYLENLDKITPSQTDMHLERKYFIQKQTDAGMVLTAVDATHEPHTGDLLKVVVYLKAGRDFEYVQLKDMRPAGTEPIDALSTYKYQDGLFYYQVTKDAATNFFINNLNKGSYVFEYSLRVVQPGNFATGISSVQCVYAPEFNAHSVGGRMVVRP